MIFSLQLQVVTCDLLRRVRCIESALEMDSTQIETDEKPT